MRRRTFLKTAGAGSVVALAGCSATKTDSKTTDNGTAGVETTTRPPRATIEGTPSGTLRVATYDSFTGKDTAGNYLKSAFEKAHPDVTVKFVTPSNGVNQYIQQKKAGSEIKEDLYVGLNTGELVRADSELNTSLFQHSRSYLDRKGALKSELEIDPRGRAIPYDTGYISLVYDKSKVEQPKTFDDLLKSRYDGDLIVQNAQSSDPGRAFLLWTIAAKGEDGYLDYWQKLVGNDVQILKDWQAAYQAYMNGQAPMVVSYSTDQVYYHGEGVNMDKHQVGFLNDQGYANPEAMARFADTDKPALARLFMDFILQPEHQAEIAVKNVQFPAVTDATLPESFSKYAYEPPKPVTFTYDQLQGKVDGWIDEWARQVASK